MHSQRISKLIVIHYLIYLIGLSLDVLFGASIFDLDHFLQTVVMSHFFLRHLTSYAHVCVYSHLRQRQCECVCLGEREREERKREGVQRGGEWKKEVGSSSERVG